MENAVNQTKTSLFDLLDLLTGQLDQLLRKNAEFGMEVEVLAEKHELPGSLNQALQTVVEGQWEITQSLTDLAKQWIGNIRLDIDRYLGEWPRTTALPPVESSEKVSA
jgi:hypothetical protein